MRHPLEAPSDAADIWRLYLYEEDAEIPCNSVHRFLMLLNSPSTKYLERWRHKEAEDEVHLCLTSSIVCDDEGVLFAQKTIHREDMWDLSHEERRAFKDALLRLRVCERDKKNYLLKDPVGTRTSAVIKRLGLTF